MRLKGLLDIGEMSAAEDHGFHAAVLEPCREVMQVILLNQSFRRCGRFDGQNQRQKGNNKMRKQRNNK